MLRALLLCSLVVATVACARSRAPADDDVDGLSRYLFQNWERPTRVADGMTNLAIWIEGPGREEAARTEGFLLTALSEDEVGDLEHSTRRFALTDLVGAVVAASSPWSIDHHAALLPMQDQTWNAPDNYDLYVRTVVEGEPDAFLDPTAADRRLLIRTDNDVVQTRRIGPWRFTVPYRLRKDYRWTETDAGGRAIIGRTWAPRPGCTGNDTDEGGVCLELSFSVDLFYESPQGDTMRLTASWNRMHFAGAPVTEKAQVQTLTTGMLNVFKDTDVFLGELHPDGP